MAAMNQWILCFIILGTVRISATQYLDSIYPNDGGKICRTVISYTRASLETLKGCVVVLGDVRINLMERSNETTNLTYPELKEITGYLMVYRIQGLTSLGQLFPGLTRIRGHNLFMNYALIVHDIPKLREVGLYSLTTIDRGSIIIYAEPTTCFLDTIIWDAIAPKVRHVISREFPENGLDGLQCTMTCRCTDKKINNYCWNNKVCQKFVDGPEAETCHEQCLGCKKSDKLACSVCRHYTFNGTCVPSCPSDTYVLEENKYCLTLKQCHDVMGWIFNKTCTVSCPVQYKQVNQSGNITCEPCPKCEETCGNVSIKSVAAIQEAGRCVYINGSLTIYLRAVTEAMDELRMYMTRIKEVKDYVAIYGSLVITSLDFLSSLTHIHGKVLKKGIYSLLIYDMVNLQTLFTDKVVKNLTIHTGVIKIYNNPMLCKKEIDKMNNSLPVAPTELDIPVGMNGYGGGCTHVHLRLNVTDVEDETAVVTFSREDNRTISYTVLYLRLLPGEVAENVPESCSETKWQAVDIEPSPHLDVKIILNDLKPASNYVLCIEIYDQDARHLRRSPLVKFFTKVGIPAPPFLTEVVASTANTINVHWVDHMDYSQYITHYILNVMLIDVSDDDVNSRNQCEDNVDQQTLSDNYEFSPHAIVKRPPDGYEHACETLCGILSKTISGAMVQEDFDPCTLGLNCEHAEEPDNVQNSTFTAHNYFSSVLLLINGSKGEYQVSGLAPYRDYKVQLRACTNTNCSRSSRRVVRTKALRNADLVHIVSASAFNGNVTVEWEPPEVPNGPVLSYTLEVKVKRIYPETSTQIPQRTCVPSTLHKATVMTVKRESYIVSVCTTTLVPDMSCTEFMPVAGVNTEEYRPNSWKWWWTMLAGASGTVVIFLASYYGQVCFEFLKYVRRISAERLLGNRRESDESAAPEQAGLSAPPIVKTSTKSQTVVQVELNPFKNPKPSTSRAAVDIELTEFKGTIDEPSHEKRKCSPIQEKPKTKLVIEESSQEALLLEDHKLEESPVEDIASEKTFIDTKGSTPGTNSTSLTSSSEELERNANRPLIRPSTSREPDIEMRDIIVQSARNDSEESDSGNNKENEVTRL